MWLKMESTMQLNSYLIQARVMLKQVNNTIVTLIPKIQNASIIKDFMPISCFFVFYKLIKKI